MTAPIRTSSRCSTKAGLEDRVTVLLRDYRDLDGRYDKLVSIEMVEAVGHQYLDTYFRACSRLLKDDGLMLLQAITIADQKYERARRAVDFIQQYIFPGGFLRWLAGRPALAALLGALGGPLAYYAGVALGAARFSEPIWQPLALLTANWAIAMPLIMKLAARHDGTAETGRRSVAPAGSATAERSE